MPTYAYALEIEFGIDLAGFRNTTNLVLLAYSEACKNVSMVGCLR